MAIKVIEDKQGQKHYILEKEKRKPVRNEYQKLCFDILKTKPIAFNPALARMLGSVKAGLLLSQLLYWWGKGQDENWIFKTVREIEEETSLTKKQQWVAQKICIKKGILEVELKGLPAKRYFKIKFDNIIKLLKKEFD